MKAHLLYRSHKLSRILSRLEKRIIPRQVIRVPCPIWIGKRATEYGVAEYRLRGRELVRHEDVEASALQEAPKSDAREDGLVPVKPALHFGFGGVGELQAKTVYLDLRPAIDVHGDHGMWLLGGSRKAGHEVFVCLRKGCRSSTSRESDDKPVVLGLSRHERRRVAGC